MFQTLFQTVTVAAYKVLEELVPKRLWILQYEGKRTDYWYVRVATGNRKYAHRSLKTTDRDSARRERMKRLQRS